MQLQWPLIELVNELHPLLSRKNIIVEQFRFVSLEPSGSPVTSLLLKFAWENDAMPYGVHIPLPTDDLSPLTGLDLCDAQDWAGDVIVMLGEDLGTGFVTVAQRVQHENYIELKSADPRWGVG